MRLEFMEYLRTVMTVLSVENNIKITTLALMAEPIMSKL